MEYPAKLLSHALLYRWNQHTNEPEGSFDSSFCARTGKVTPPPSCLNCDGKKRLVSVSGQIVVVYCIPDTYLSRKAQQQAYNAMLCSVVSQSAARLSPWCADDHYIQTDMCVWSHLITHLKHIPLAAKAGTI